MPEIFDASRGFQVPPPSTLRPVCHPLVHFAAKEVDDYYLAHYGFPNEKVSTKFIVAGFSQVTCLYFPKALDERIVFACSLLTILFLIDGQPLFIWLFEARLNFFRPT